MNTLGKDGETLAVKFLKGKGYRILEKNYRTVFGEIDIIAKDEGVVVFIEVKTRSDDQFGYPFEAVNRRKREKMRKVALCFMKKLRGEVPARFDVLSISMDDGPMLISHIKDAFEV
ncbi:MAG: YraN family protein [Nitrospirae bacterium]|nr:YraN family protein [Nitrospirota bacterium]